MLYSFMIFSFAFLIGVLAALLEPDFLRVALGDGYVDMTLENIEKGDPMGVYKDMPSFAMFPHDCLQQYQGIVLCIRRWDSDPPWDHVAPVHQWCSDWGIYDLFPDAKSHLGSSASYLHTRDLGVERDCHCRGGGDHAGE